LLQASQGGYSEKRQKVASRKVGTRRGIHQRRVPARRGLGSIEG